MNNIILIGMTGAGKTTIGKLLANKINMNFVDTDDLIYQKVGKTPREIVTEEGKEVFLQLQTDLVVALDVQNYVIATGGSVLESTLAAYHLQMKGTVVYLSVPFEIIERRMDPARPLAKTSTQSLYELFCQREVDYIKHANIICDCFDKSKEDIVNWIQQKIKEVKPC